MQSSTEFSTLADEYSSTVSVSDKSVPSGESTAAGQKVSSSVSQSGGWLRAGDEAAASKNSVANKPHLIYDIESEGTILACIVG